MGERLRMGILCSRDRREVIMRFDAFSFGSIRIDGVTYQHDVIIDQGHVRKRKKKPSKKFRDPFGHTVWCLFLKASIQTKPTSQLGKSLAGQGASRFDIGPHRNSSQNAAARLGVPACELHVPLGFPAARIEV